MEEHPQTDVIYPANIESVNMYIMDDNEYRSQSKGLITSPVTQRDNVPTNDGVNSLRLGTTNIRLLCSTCKNNKNECPTHFGHISLRYPVQIAIDNDIMIRWLKIICFSCGNLLSNRDISSFPDAKKLSALVGFTRDSDKICSSCKALHPTVYVDKAMPVEIWTELPGDGNDAEPIKTRLYNHKMVEIFERVTNATVIKAGLPLTSHPRRMLYYHVPCPPVGLRPGTVINGRPSSNDATTIAKSLISANLKVPITLEEPITPAISRVLTNLDMIYRALIRGSETSGSNSTPKFQIVSNTNRKMMGMFTRLPKKVGDIRSRNLAVRTDHMLRFVITCGTRTHLREFGIPLRQAKKMVIPMTIRSDNMDWGMMMLMNSKTDTYPMITRIKRPITNLNMLASSFAERGNTLEIGDVIYRQLMDGDMMQFNRQPSLKRESMNTHFIKVYDQLTGEHNVSDCRLYNSDFDGDAMNGILATSQKARAEQLILNNIDGAFISLQDAAPMYGCFQDTLIEIALITRNEVLFTRSQLMGYLRNLPNHTLADLVLDKKKYTGREAVSLLMLPINYEGTTHHYNDAFAPYLPYKKEDVEVRIERGQIVSGILDAKTIGQGVAGSIFHRMCSEYGPNDSTDVLYNMQHLGHEYAYDHGFTFHFGDITLDPALKELKDAKISNILSQSDEITRKVENGELIAPVGQSVEDYYEEIMTYGILKHGDDFREPIMRSIALDNNYFIMAMHGKKGKYLNMQQVMACIGQQTIHGKRALVKNFGFARSSSHFSRYDNSALASGFITSSYIRGVGPDEILGAAKEARQSIVNIALSTSKTGQANRDFCNALQSNMTNALRQTVKNQQMIQPLYGEAGVDPSKMVKVLFPTVMPSDMEFKKEYHNSATQYKEKNQKELQAMMDDEFDHITNERNSYRSNYIALDSISEEAYNFSSRGYVAVDVNTIVKDILYDYRDSNQKAADPVWLIPHVEKFCNSLAYVFTNEKYQKRGAKHCKIHTKACQPIAMLVRTYLCSAAVKRNGMSKGMVEIALDSVFVTLKFALVGFGICVGMQAGQSYSEPATQRMLDSHHRAGGGGSKVDAMTRTTELSHAKPTDKMKMPTMRLYVLEKFEDDLVAVQNIANLIESMQFKLFIRPQYNVLFEQFGNPAYHEFAGDIDMMKEFAKNNVDNQPPQDLINWCIRFELDVDAMVTKNITMSSIIYALNASFPDIYIVYNSVFDSSTIMRCYFKNSLFKKAKYVDDTSIDDIAKKIKNIDIRGITGVISARAETKNRSYIAADGSIANKEFHYIETQGTNLPRIVSLTKYFQVEKCQSDSIREVEDVWGLEAARHKIMCEFTTLVGGSIMPQHLRMISDEMCAQGRVVGLVGDSNMAKREKNNWLLRIAYMAPKRNITSAAYAGVECPVYGVSGPLLMGQTPKIGPNFYTARVNNEFTSKNVMSSDDIIAAL
jgi:DNA-directed RNA polymerase II subunit RPB1